MLKGKLDFSSRFRILKGGKISLVVSAVLGSAVIASASPSGGTITSGTANISQNGTVTNINQSTNKATINWQNFSVGSNETVNFNQPSASSITLNRVVGTTSSLINGVINANGQVFLVNPNGVVFSKTATVNVGGLVATTQNITDENFEAGNYLFEGNSQNSVLNMGTITANNGGYVALMGKTVQNEGVISAIMGNVQLAGGDKISLNLNGNSLVKLTIDEGTFNALIENKGLIKADGGQVFLTTQALNTILDGMVNNTGVIEAKTLNDVTGKIITYAHGGTTNVSGTLDATGGFIETSGDVLHISDGTTIKAKNWLLDPVDLTVADQGGDITGATISAALDGGADVTLQTTSSSADCNGTSCGSSGNGDIFVNDAITWTSGNTLTFDAYRNIRINSAIDASGGSGKVSLLYGQGAAANENTATYGFGLTQFGFTGNIKLSAGQNFSTKLGSDGSIINYTVINGADDAAIAASLMTITKQNANVNYALGADLDLNGIAWTPIGDSSSNAFKGRFDGLGHTINNLTLNDTGGNGNQGLFGFTVGAVIRDIGILNPNIISTGGYQVGALVGAFYTQREGEDSIIDSYSASGSVSGAGSVGGLIGIANSVGSIKNSYSTTDVTGTQTDVGGLIGKYSGAITPVLTSLYNSYATGAVHGASAVGGLVGYSNGKIASSYATGAVTGDYDQTGGLVGYNNYIITDSYATGDVTGGGWGGTGGLVGQNAQSYSNRSIAIINSHYGSSDFTSTVRGLGDVGGLIGFNNAGNIETSYSIGNVEGGVNIGGLVGRSYYYSVISKSYATGTVTGTNGYVGNAGTGTGANVGGLVGKNDSSKILQSYSTGAVSGDRDVGGFVGYNTGNSQTLIENSYSTSDASASGSSGSVGGFVGINETIITNSYSTGVASTSGSVQNIGGFVGDNTTFGEITNSFWKIHDGQQTTDTASSGTTGLDEVGLVSSTTFSGTTPEWDVANINNLGNVKPQLRWDYVRANGFGSAGVGTSVWIMGPAPSGGGSTPTPPSGGGSGGGSTPPPPSGGDSGTGSTPTSLNNGIENQVADIVTTIQNRVNQPNKMREPKNEPISIAKEDIKPQTFVETVLGENSGLEIVSATNNEVVTDSITLEEIEEKAKKTKKTKKVETDTEIRVPVSRDRVVELINGGVRLPTGVSQQFFLVKGN